jgi:hypothetical protein
MATDTQRETFAKPAVSGGALSPMVLLVPGRRIRGRGYLDCLTGFGKTHASLCMGSFRVIEQAPIGTDQFRSQLDGHHRCSSRISLATSMAADSPPREATTGA